MSRTTLTQQEKADLLILTNNKVADLQERFDNQKENPFSSMEEVSTFLDRFNRLKTIAGKLTNNTTTGAPNE